ncbi:hypothetical protein N7532_001886 [Penicillium argentinense]|uniref:Cyanovirin-N domain-containing protein n=1 Tax=Penicillium argentinense TaxID=1131581 RepID=A0A9W9G3L7_9EURO|nr:uncharacterized protein N7532_001886 [Penicillium argentinense]KAJ5111351.1 hypothetical protein N7532_001886 [Penicillium argentinense]
MRHQQATALLLPLLSGIVYASDCQYAWNPVDTFTLIYTCQDGATDITARMDMNLCLINRDGQLYAQDVREKCEANDRQRGYAFKTCDPLKCSVSGDNIDCDDAGCGSIAISDAVQLDGANMVCPGHTATATTEAVSATPTGA